MTGLSHNGAAQEPGPAPDRRLRPSQRLRESRLFRQAYDQGRKAVGRYMVFWIRSGPDASLRLGVVAGRRVGNAVHRARAKRRLREAYRLNRNRLSGAVDVVLVARAALLQASPAEIERELLALAGRLRICGRASC